MFYYLRTSSSTQGDAQRILDGVFDVIDEYLMRQGLQRDYEHERMTREHLGQYEVLTMHQQAYCYQIPWVQVFLAREKGEDQSVCVSAMEGYARGTGRGEELIEFLTALCVKRDLVLTRSQAESDEEESEAREE